MNQNDQSKCNDRNDPSSSTLLFETTYWLRAIETLEQCNDSIRHNNKEANENPCSNSKNLANYYYEEEPEEQQTKHDANTNQSNKNHHYKLYNKYLHLTKLVQ